MFDLQIYITYVKRGCTFYGKKKLKKKNNNIIGDGDVVLQKLIYV